MNIACVYTFFTQCQDFFLILEELFNLSKNGINRLHSIYFD